MEKNIEEILGAISDKLSTRMSVVKVNDVFYHAYHDVNTSKYGSYTIEEFLQLYKINRMFELGAISKEERENLTILFHAKRKLNRKLGEECLKEMRPEDIYSNERTYTSKIKAKLHREIERIEKEFDKYSLNLDDIELKTIIDTIINGEGYKNWIATDTEQLKEVAKEVKRLKL